MEEMVKTEFSVQKSLDHPNILAVHGLYSAPALSSAPPRLPTHTEPHLHSTHPPL